ncbi:jg17208 [Pararge aegeria aegeria]|uniref:Jg17208 protein n=1 Tax=Pararge aegeria aegeria TaxID=348720 RepID=A0A8S4SDC5_9NEOP|nr:jg17208 [Pararge aegeria aegeria]
MRRTDGIKRVAGTCWTQAAQYHVIWNSLQNTYVRGRSLVDMTMMMIGQKRLTMATEAYTICRERLCFRQRGLSPTVLFLAESSN